MNLVTRTQRNLFEILLNLPEIRLYLPFSDGFETKWTSVCFQINRKIVNTIWFLFDLTRFGKNVSVCIHTSEDDKCNSRLDHKSPVAYSCNRPASYWRILNIDIYISIGNVCWCIRTSILYWILYQDFCILYQNFFLILKNT